MAAAQLNLLQDDTATAGARLAKEVVDAIMLAKTAAVARSERFTNRDMLRIATPICEKALETAALTRAPRALPKRAELFAAMAKACGMDMASMTMAESRLVGVAMAHIKEAMPDVTAEEIERRVAAYRRKYPTAACTPSAMMNNWSVLGSRPTVAKPDVYKEPDGWKESATAQRAVYGGVDDTAWEEIVRRGWFDLGTNERMQILVAMK